MIRRARFQNFQSHKDTEMEFCGGVNVILGLSDHGKSAALRALFWNLYNRPLGEGFVTYGAEFSRVSVALESNSESITLIREKNSKGNIYLLGDKDYQAFGSEIPVDILKAHNIDRELTVQTQIDPFFLIQSSPGEVAKHFNKVAHISDIDPTFRAIEGIVRQSRVKAQLSSSRIAGIDAELEKYDSIPSIQEMLLRLEGMEEGVRQAIRSRTLIDKTVSEVESCEAKAKEYEDIPKIERGLNRLEELSSDQYQKIRERETISMHVIQILWLESEEKNLAELQELSPRMIELEDLHVSMTTLLFQSSKLQSTLNILLEHTANLLSAEEELAIAEKEFTEAMGDTCPLCGQKV